MLVAVLAMTACNDAQCPLNNVVLTHYAFYAIDENGQSQAVALTDTLTVRACGTDSILINKLLKASELELPMSYVNAEDTLVFEYINDGVYGRDTIRIAKTDQPHYESPDCPTSMFHIITSASHTDLFIDSVVVVKPSVNYDLQENIRIYFRSGN